MQTEEAQQLGSQLDLQNEEELAAKMKAFNERRLAKQLNEQPPIISEPIISESSKKLLEAQKSFTCSSLYKELKNNNKQVNITEHGDLNFDSNEVSLISDLVMYLLNIKKEEMDVFINNNGKIFTTEDFRHPIFKKILILLISEITINKIILNNKVILEDTVYIETGEIIDRSAAAEGGLKTEEAQFNHWAIKTFTPNLLSEYTTKYQDIFEPETFNRIFIQILITLFGDNDYLKFQHQLKRSLKKIFLIFVLLI
jgi:hypothetical protein